MACTGFFKGCWERCCYKHDIDYEAGIKSKLDADLDLHDCIYYKGHPIVAAIVFTGVSTIGWFFWLRCRWRSVK